MATRSDSGESSGYDVLATVHSKEGLVGGLFDLDDQPEYYITTRLCRYYGRYYALVEERQFSEGPDNPQRSSNPLSELEAMKWLLSNGLPLPDGLSKDVLETIFQPAPPDSQSTVSADSGHDDWNAEDDAAIFRKDADPGEGRNELSNGTNGQPALRTENQDSQSQQSETSVAQNDAPRATTSAICATTFGLFPKGIEDINEQRRQFVHFMAETASEGRSKNQIARDFLTKTGCDPKLANSILTWLRRAIKDGSVNLP